MFPTIEPGTRIAVGELGVLLNSCGAGEDDCDAGHDVSVKEEEAQHETHDSDGNRNRVLD